MGLETLVLEKGLAGGLMLEIPVLENYPGFPDGISGQELAELMARQARKHGAEIREMEEAIRMDLKGEPKVVETRKATYEAKAVVIATGCSHRTLGVPGEEEFRGRGVSYCGICDGPSSRARRSWWSGEVMRPPPRPYTYPTWPRRSSSSTGGMC